MLYYKSENLTFNNRKEAKIFFGSGRFNRLVKDNQIIFSYDNPNSCAIYESVSTITKQATNNK
jgi:hypothetical protein